MKASARRRVRLYPAMSPNGRLVHLTDVRGMPMCGSATMAHCRVQSCITCSRCAAVRPAQAKRHQDKRRAIGIDRSPFYDAVRRAILTGGSEPRETFRTVYAPR